MTAAALPHETPLPGPAADLAARIAAAIPVIETARLRLRAPRLTDLPAWHEIFLGPSAPFLGGPFDRDDSFTDFAATVGLWLLRGHGVWAVEPRDGGATLGFVLVGFEPGDREPELGYLFTPAGEGRGYATEAAQAARDWALHSMHLPSLVSYVAPDNTRSQRLAARLGAVPDGCEQGSTVWRHAPQNASGRPA
jgi:RimJ/RimL family protein N-acetyltransferase